MQSRVDQRLSAPPEHRRGSHVSAVGSGMLRDGVTLLPRGGLGSRGGQGWPNESVPWTTTDRCCRQPRGVVLLMKRTGRHFMPPNRLAANRPCAQTGGPAVTPRGMVWLVVSVDRAWTASERSAK